ENVVRGQCGAGQLAQARPAASVGEQAESVERRWPSRRFTAPLNASIMVATVGTAGELGLKVVLKLYLADHPGAEVREVAEILRQPEGRVRAALNSSAEFERSRRGFWPFWRETWRLAAPAAQ